MVKKVDELGLQRNQQGLAYHLGSIDLDRSMTSALPRKPTNYAASKIGRSE